VLDLLRRPSSKDAANGGKALIYVWALEQKDSRRGWDEGHEQDVMVPWVMKTREKPKKEKGKGKKKAELEEASGDHEKTPEAQPESKTYLRYYHLYKKGELEHDINEAGGIVIENGYEKDNWWAIATPSSNT
jgi:tRNA (uracil-5-)-methyltransferase TRM9